MARRLSATVQRVLGISIAVLIVLVNVRAGAAAATGTFNIVSTVTVASVCTYNGTPTLGFASYDPIITNATTPATATAALSVVCPVSLAYAVTANLGLHSGSATDACATGTCTRAMSNGSGFLSYDIYTTSSHTTVWNTANGIAGTGSGTAQSIDVYGYIPAAELAPTGSYADTVTVTVSF